MKSINKIEEEAVLNELCNSGAEFITLFEKNSLSVEIYKPHLSDNQKPHDRDEFYLIISGEGKFQLLDEVTSFKKGDFLFVPAYTEHRFIQFSEDFITWVFFIK
ncbi:cupin domain-containing protein [Pontibacter sp. 13R65]|uniref:cupin domain-containing protein n=1 Tax=Pontibacter sp. 13R65 TaxID=3127458 RepID=UPI00301E547D